MKHINITFLLAMLISMAGVKTYAYDFEVDGIYYNWVSVLNQTCKVTYGGDNMNSFKYTGIINIPESVIYKDKTFKVIGIGNYAFYNDSIQSIVLPEGLEYIDSYAFYGCPIENLSIPKTLKVVNNTSFNNLKNIFISDLSAYLNITGGFTVTVPFEPNSQERRLSRLFLNNQPLEYVVIPEGCNIVENKFRNISSIKEVNISEGVNKIGSHAFEGCNNLHTVTIPSTCTDIGDNAFDGCTNLSRLTIKEGIKRISIRNSFRNCNSLCKISIPSSVEEIYGDNVNFTSNYYIPNPEIYYSMAEIVLASGCLDGNIYSSSSNKIISRVKISSFECNRNFTCDYITNDAYASPKIKSPFHSVEDISLIGKVVLGEKMGSVPRKAFYKCNIDSLIIPTSSSSLYLQYSEYEYEYFAPLTNGAKGSYHCYTCSPFVDVPIKYIYIDRDLTEIDNPFKTHKYQKQTYWNSRYGESTRTVTVSLWGKRGGPFYATKDTYYTFESIETGDSLNNLKMFDFPKYGSLAHLRIGKNINSIPSLIQNKKLRTVIVTSITPPIATDFANETYAYGTLFVPIGCRDAYTKADVWKGFLDIQEMDFGNADAIENVTITNNTESIPVSNYDVFGRQLPSIQRGLNIQKMSDGTTKKIIVK